MFLSCINKQNLKWIILVVIVSVWIAACTEENSDLEQIGNILLLAGQMLIILGFGRE
ncbi:MAG: hypothetical protein H9893_03775 [Candidatus Niameybacter stercoravium]|nr:hypothetical protein [Candidatus Niameybacter stercoravium]